MLYLRLAVAADREEVVERLKEEMVVPVLLWFVIKSELHLLVMPKHLVVLSVSMVVKPFMHLLLELLQPIAIGQQQM